MKKRYKAMKRTAKAVAAAAAAAAPLTLAAPALASTEAISDVPNLVLSANSYRWFHLAGENITLTRLGSGAAAQAFLSEEGVLFIETKAIGTETFTLSGKHDGEPFTDTFTVNVIDAGIGGRIDIADIIAFTKSNAEQADTNAEVAGLLQSLQPVAANQPPTTKLKESVLELESVPIGASNLLDLRPYFVDPEGSTLSYSVVPISGEGEHLDLSEYAKIEYGNSLRIHLPYGFKKYDEEGTDVLTNGLVKVAVSDASGNTSTQLISIPYYKSAFLWDNSEYGPGYEFASFDVHMKEFDEITGEASVEIDDSLIPPGITANGYFSSGTLHVTLYGSEGMELGSIPTLPIVFTVQADDRILELPLVFRKSAGGPNPPATVNYMYQLGLTPEEAAEHPTFNQPINLKTLFNDPDMIVGDELTYTVTGISPSLPIDYELDRADGTLSFSFDPSEKQNGLGYTDYVMNVKATDSTGNLAETSIRIDMNEAPKLLHDGLIVFHGDDTYSSKYLHTVVQDDGGIGGLTKAFDPPEAAAAAGASFGLESSTMALIVEGHPTETQTFNLKFADVYGRKAVQPVTVIAPELKTLEVDSHYASVNLDVLFQEPDNVDYTYFVVNDAIHSGYTTAEGDWMHLNSYGEGSSVGTVTIGAEADDVHVKDIRFTISIPENLPDWHTVSPTLTVSDDVYVGAIGIEDLFPEDGILPTDTFAYVSSDSDFIITEFDPDTEQIFISYTSQYISSAAPVYLSIVRLRDGVYRAVELTVWNQGV